MKPIIPWLCLAAVTHATWASTNEGIDAYREGHYRQAAQQLSSLKQADSIIEYYLGRMRLYGYGQLKNNAQAIRHFKLAADKGFLPAIQIMESYSLLVEHNPEAALVWFKKAADMNDVNSQMYCAAAYSYGIGAKKNPDIAKKYFIMAAKNGNDIAQTALAESFFETRQMANKKLGLLWLEKAVAQNNPQAQILMGELYLHGELFAKDPLKAKEMIGLAVKQNYAPAVYAMGKMAVSQEQWQEAKDWFTQAANIHYNPAEIALADFFANEKNPLHDQHASFKWTLKAAQNGSLEAQRSLAYMYKNGLGVNPDPSLAEVWQQKAAQTAKNATQLATVQAVNWLTNGKASKFSDTPYRLQGIFSTWQNPSVLKENNYNQPPQMQSLHRATLFKPQFVMTNPDKIAISEYYDMLVSSLQDIQKDKLLFPQYPLKSATVGANSSAPSTPASLNPAVAKSEGFDYLQQLTAKGGGADDYQSVFKKLEGQAILGDSTAQFDLGQMYQHGLGVKKDPAAAAKYYRLAMDQQDLRAEYNLALLHLQGEGVPVNYNLGMNLLQDAAFKGNLFAQYVTARINEQGYKDTQGQEVLKPDLERAIAMYHLAAANDYGPAQYRLAEILVREKQTDLTQAEKIKRTQLVKDLYQGAVLHGETAAALPLAFYNAMDKQPQKQAEALAVAKASAEKGDSNAALLLGLLYDRGVAVKVDRDEAIRWYQKATLNPVTAFILGTYMTQGIGLSQDLEKGRALLQQAAQANFPYAHLNLAILNQQNHQEFLPGLNKARELGNSTAGLLLADYYLSRADSEEQMKQAREIYQYFAKRGNQNGQLKLGYLCEHGLGGSVDIPSAEQWYLAAAQQGQPIAQYLLGRLYQLGWLGKQPDYLEAKKWYAMAQNQYTPASVARGFIYDTVDDNYQQAMVDYQRAADKGDPVGQFDLGLIYEKGKGRAVDFAQAKECYTKAAAQGVSQAMVQLGGMYLNGLLGARDEKEAMDWYQKAAKLGDPDALYQLGFLTETGAGTKLDYPAAVRYYQQAATQGHAKATLALARMYQYGLGVPKDAVQAEKLYKQLSALDNPSVQTN